MVLKLLPDMTAKFNSMLCDAQCCFAMQVLNSVDDTCDELTHILTRYVLCSMNMLFDTGKTSVHI